MKKFLSGLIAALLLSAGFVAVSGEVANAAPSYRACKPSKYVTCPATKTTATAPKSVRRNKTATVKVAIKANGNVKPKGTVTIVIKGPKGFKKTIKKAYSGKTVSVKTPKLKTKGTYKVTITFSSTNTRNPATKSLTIKVKK